MSKLENDCMSMLKYADSQKGRWISVGELVEMCNIPPSTARNILMVAKSGIFIKKDETGSTVHPDVFDKIAVKFRYEYVIKKMRNDRGRLTWHLSAVLVSYNTSNAY